MTSYPFIATAAFGIEGIVARELRFLGISATAENGGARFSCNLEQAYRANLCLRTADRVLLVLAEQNVYTFEDLYQLMLSIPWEKYADRNTNFHLNGKCVRSKLMSIRDCQAVGKKAIVNRLSSIWHVNRLPETGVEMPINISVVNNKAVITLDMSGLALNKRGYRTWNGEAPIRETLAAALIELSPWKPEQTLYDPCCGTGTILIEAAMRATKLPSGSNRSFACEQYPFMKAIDMKSIRSDCIQAAKQNALFSIEGSDISAEALNLCNLHIKQAGFSNRIIVHQQDLQTVQRSENKGVFILNPPYGERLSDRETARELYKEIGKLYRRHVGWSMCVITADPAFERYFGQRADHKKRFYNGRLECEYFIYQAK